MVNYICEKCGKVFSQKCHYGNHMNKKIPCDFKGNNINEIVEEKIMDTISNLNNEIKNFKIDLNLDLINTYNKMNTEELLNTTSIISNKDALRDTIHEIHNYLRNNGVGYGMNALKVFNIFYGLKKIEDNNLFEKLELNEEIKFSKLLQLANKEKGLELYNLIYDVILTDIKAHFPLIFYEISENIKTAVFIHLIKQINQISQIEESCNVLLSGNIYEYFIGRDESAISELGAYFTNRTITDYIYNKTNPQINEDGSIKTMIDMYGGSGGFTTGYIKYLKENNENINWKTELNKVYHFDMNEDVIKSAGLEFFCLTGIIPNETNLQVANSFTHSFSNKKFDYIYTNPPYGGDKSKKSSAEEKRDKIKKYNENDIKNNPDNKELLLKRNKQLKEIKKLETKEKEDKKKQTVCLDTCKGRIGDFATEYSLKSNDKEGCSLIQMMEMLEINGTAVGVLKEGVFFNSKYKEIRKVLIENFNVREVISVPQDQFENTSTKTSILIFDNTEEKTQNVRFSELNLIKYEEDTFIEVKDNIILETCKGDIKEVAEVYTSTASKNEILNNAICSLNGKDYNKKTIICSEDYELVKLGDICECLSTTKHYTNIGKKEGQYKFYNSSQNSNLFVDFCEVNDLSIILGQGGNFNIHIDKNFTASKHVCVIQSKYNDNILLKFIYNIIPELQKKLITNGSTISWLNKTNINNLKIPIPKSQEKIQEWVDKISTPYNEKNEKQNQIKELELSIQNRIKEIGDNEECEEVELGNVCKFISGPKKNTTQGKSIGKYPLFSSSLIVDNWVDDYDYNEGSIIINTINGSGKFNLQYSNKFCATTNTIIFNTSNINITKYIYYYGLINIDNICNLANGSTKKKMGKKEISKFKISIPKNKKLIKDLEPTFQQIETLQNEVKTAEELYKQYIKELSEEAIPPTLNENVENTENTIISNLTEENVKKLEEPKKKDKKVKSDTSSKTSVKALKEQCKSLGIKDYSSKKKDELIKMIKDFEES
tara:strand:- start:1939 stop:4938 length:3000 start_codon:yes stop_codon:yes gene_type:complete